MEITSSTPGEPRRKGKKEEAPSSPLDMFPELRGVISAPWSFDQVEEKPKPARPPREAQAEISRHFVPENRYLPGDAPEFVDFSVSKSTFRSHPRSFSHALPPLE